MVREARSNEVRAGVTGLRVVQLKATVPHVAEVMRRHLVQSKGKGSHMAWERMAGPRMGGVMER